MKSLFMKKLLLLSIMMCWFSFAKSQCSSEYGLVNNSGKDWSLVMVDKYSGVITVLDTIFSAQLLDGGASTIEPDSSYYVFLASDTSLGSLLRIYTVNYNTGKLMYQPLCDSVNLSDIHYDIKRKKIFGIESTSDSLGNYTFSLVTINQVNGQVMILDSIAGMNGIYGGTSTVGIDNGRYYIFMGDNTGTEWLYALDETTGKVVYKLQDTNLYGCSYDTVSKYIYGINYGRFCKLNPATGAITVVSNIPNMGSVLDATPTFSQDSLEFFTVGEDTVTGNEMFYTVKATTGNTLYKPLLGTTGSSNYDATEYAPCGKSYCSNSYNEPICIVTVDTANNKAEVIWGRTNSPTGSGFYNVYKDTVSGFTLIHKQPLSEISEYVDTTSFPFNGPETYEISTVDSCGESSLSSPHTTIYLTTTSGTNVYILNWTPYIGFTPSKYRIFRGLSMNTLKQIDSVSNTVFTYHDTLPPIGAIYLVEAVNPSGVCVPTAKIKYRNTSSILSGSFSNGFNTGSLPTGINNSISMASGIQVYPNPNNGEFTVKCSANSESFGHIIVYNMFGEEVYTLQCAIGNSQFTLDLSNLPQGIYTLHVELNNGTIVKKLIIER